MFGIGFGEFMIFAVVLLIAVGPGRMPKLMKAVGKGLREFRKASDELRKQSGIDELMREDPAGLRQLQKDIQRTASGGAAAPPRKIPRLSSDDLVREQPPEGVDIVHARAQAIQRRTEKTMERRQARKEAAVAETMLASAGVSPAGPDTDDADDVEDAELVAGPVAREDDLDAMDDPGAGDAVDEAKEATS